MRDIPALLHHSGRLQHILRRDDARRPYSTCSARSDPAQEEVSPHRRFLPWDIRHHRRNTEQVLQLFKPAYHDVHDLVYPRVLDSHLCNKPDVLVAPPAQVLRSPRLLRPK